jgi:hypothetical protein
MYLKCLITLHGALKRDIFTVGNTGKKLETLAFSGCLTWCAPLASLEASFRMRVSSLASGVLVYWHIAVATGNQVNTNVIINK